MLYFTPLIFHLFKMEFITPTYPKIPSLFMLPFQNSHFAFHLCAIDKLDNDVHVMTKNAK